MNWIEVSITTTSAGTEFVEGQLLNSGISGWQVIDMEEMRTCLAENPRSWDYIDERLFEDISEFVTVKFYTADDDAGSAALEAVKARLAGLKSSMLNTDLGPLAVSLKQVDDEGWLENWKKYFKPIEIGERIVIKPEWEEYAPSGRIVVSINPGNAFGTGAHETTRMCIEALDRNISPGDTMLDLGCGSGILSVTALLLGADKCIALDINPDAAAITSKNAGLNGIPEEKLYVFTGDIINSPYLQKKVKALEYDCIAANIAADSIIALSALIAGMGCLKAGGVLIASGIIADRSKEVHAALISAGYSIAETVTSGEWVCIIAAV